MSSPLYRLNFEKLLADRGESIDRLNAMTYDGVLEPVPNRPHVHSGFWRVAAKGACWVCGARTKWAWADLGYQHPDCDAYPTESGDVTIVRGVRVGGSDE